jgi:hypothetical protein
MISRKMTMLAVAVLLTLSVSVQAAGPRLINYQGILTNDLGQPLEGPFDLTFRIYADESGGTALWIETHTTVAVDRGVFNVVLGGTAAFPANLFSVTQRWLGITVGSDPELAPRQRFTSVPWAMRSTVADTAIFSLSGGSGAGWALSGDNMYATVPGNVGIGQTAPAKKLHVGSHTVPNSEGMIRLSSRSGTQGSNRTWDIGVPETDADTSGPGYSFIINDTNNDTEADFMIKYGTGNVGIGTVTPGARLDIVRPTGSSVPVARWNTLTTMPGGLIINTSMTFDGSSIDVTTPLTTPALRLNHTAAGNVLLAGGGGNVGIGTSSPAAKLEVAGTARVAVLEIAGADLAEKFPVSGQSEPGTVVVIDPDRPGALRPSQLGYDSRVAGVVSGAGGLSVGAVLGHCTPEPDAQPIALSGRVWTWCDATEHAIEPGDLLTTSGRPGHAMKAVDPSRAHGAVLGKAMSHLARGETGLVLVLINLQ